RIRGHRKWLLDPPKAQPTRDDFGLPEFTLIPKDHLAAAQASVRKQVDRWEIDWSTMLDSEKVYVTGQVSEFLGEISAALGPAGDRTVLREVLATLSSEVGDNYQSGPDVESAAHSAIASIQHTLETGGSTVDDAKWLAGARVVGLDENLIYVMQKEREYEAARRHWKQYKNWEKSRNPARAALEAAHGYDTKHGAHLVRLLKMAREILETGKVNVWRGDIDREELLAIRGGAWDYDKLVDWAETEDKALQDLYKQRKYVVPGAPNRKGIDALVCQMVEEFLSLSSPQVVVAGSIGTVNM
ncbi:hypothetical protein N9917_00005, partial [Deltaproteobacteria bacterium]|nr:hypothetical protein [Deltaproteobacteria bacterium]